MSPMPDVFELCATLLANEQVERFEKSGKPDGFLRIPSEWETRLVIERLRKLSATYACPMSIHN